MFKIKERNTEPVIKEIKENVQLNKIPQQIEELPEEEIDIEQEEKEIQARIDRLKTIKSTPKNDLSKDEVYDLMVGSLNRFNYWLQVYRRM